MVNQGESMVNWLNWLTVPLLCAGLWSWGTYHLAQKGVYWTCPEAFRMGPPRCPVQGMHTSCIHVDYSVMPQSHPTTGPVRFLSPIRFLACKAEWSPRRNFTSVLFPWSHQAMGPVRLHTCAYLWFGWTIRRTPWVPRLMPVGASYGPRMVIFNVFHILRDPYGARAWPPRVP